jgi:hypothetical protein
MTFFLNCDFTEAQPDDRNLAYCGGVVEEALVPMTVRFREK